MAAMNGLPNGGGGGPGHVSNGVSNDVDLSEAPVSAATTISTVAIQAGKTKIVLAVLKSHDWIRVRIQQMEPDLMEVGATLEEAKALRREHEELLTKLTAKQREVTELLARADDMATQNRSYQEVYAAMAESLSEAWIDLNKQLEYRKMLLDQSINFHESAQQFARKMEQAQSLFTNVGLAQDVDTARHLLLQHQDLKKSILEASMSTLQEGQLLLDRIREMGVHADVQNRHATTAACYGIEHLLELLQDRRRHLEELWLQRKVRLEQCLQLLLLDQEVNKVSDWFEKVGDVYLNKKDLGSSLAMSNALRDEHQHFEHQARDIQDTVLRLIRTADQLVHGERADAEAVRKRLQLVDSKCENFTVRLDARRKNLAMAKNFFSLAQTALTRLDEIDIQLASVSLPADSAELPDRHRLLAAAIVEASAPALREGHALLERVGRDEPGAQGVVAVLNELTQRCAKLDGQCTAKQQAGERSQAMIQFNEKFTNLSSWLNQIGLTTVGLNGDMGANLSTSRDFLEVHERLNQDIKAKKSEINAVITAAETLAKSGDAQAAEVGERAKTFKQQWEELENVVLIRIKLGQAYVTFHKKAQQLAVQFDVLEEYLKIEKLDPTQVPDSAIKHKEESFAKMNSEFSEVDSTGKRFIKDVADTKVDEKLDTRRAVVVVETILSHFSERRYLITDYYEHWKVHVVSGKEFKAQWQQFIQDARKCIDWMVKEEKALFAPYNAGQLGSSLDEAKKYLDKVIRFGPTAKKAQEDVEALLKTAELLALKGDTQGQRDQIINELLRVHTRLQARVNEYRILLNMAIKFYEDLAKLDKAIETAEKDYSSADLPMEPGKAQILLREHEANRNKIKHLVDFTSEEGETIAVRVRQQDAEAVARDEVQRVLQMTEDRRRLWEKNWDDQKAKLENNLQMCQFFFDLRFLLCKPFQGQENVLLRRKLRVRLCLQLRQWMWRVQDVP